MMNQKKKFSPAVFIGIFILIVSLNIVEGEGFSFIPLLIFGLVPFFIYLGKRKKDTEQNTSSYHSSGGDKRPDTSTMSSYPSMKKKTPKYSDMSLTEQMHQTNQDDYKMCHNCGFRVKREVIRCPICNEIIRHVDNHSDLR